MKKIFLIISACITFLIIGLLITTNFIFITEKITDKSPARISIYKKSVAVLNGTAYEDDDENYQSVFKAIQNVGNISIFSRLIHSAGLNDQIEQSNDDDYSDNISDVRKNNYCVEFIYDTKQDRIIYVDGNSKVITFDKLLYVLPTAKGVNNVIVYYAEGSNGYEKFNPLLMNGNTENIINLIDCL